MSGLINKVYIVQIVKGPFAEKTTVNSIIDDKGNVVCWDSEENAKQFIRNNGLEFTSGVIEKNFEELKSEIEQKNIQHKLKLGIRINESVEYQ